MVLFEGLTFKEEDQKNSGGVGGGRSNPVDSQTLRVIHKSAHHH